MLGGDYEEPWDAFPEDWYDDEQLRAACIQLLETCLEMSECDKEG